MSFIASKILWVILSPGNMLVLLLLLGVILGLSQSEPRRRAGRRLCVTVAVLFLLIGIFPVGGWLLLPLENRFPPNLPPHITGIVLLGGDEKPQRSERRGQPSFLDSGRRYIEFASLARKYPDAQLVYSGGSPLVTPNSTMKDAEVARQTLANLGVPVERMMVEDASRNTHENAVLSYNLVKPTPDQNWLLVTSAFHMPRAMACFRKAGWHILPATTGYQTDGAFHLTFDVNLGEHLLELAWAVHEYYGLLDYWLMGYTDELWPS